MTAEYVLFSIIAELIWDMDGGGRIDRWEASRYRDLPSRFERVRLSSQSPEPHTSPFDLIEFEQVIVLVVIGTREAQ